MPAGDAQRTWFPEMVEELRNRWHGDLSFDEIVALCDELGAMLRELRFTRHIRPPIIRCAKCGRVGPAAEPTVSVRATLLALRRFGIASEEDVKSLEKRWTAHRKAKGLDLYGKSS